MADNGIKIKDLDTVAATQDDDYVVLNNNNLTTKMLATDFKKEISGPISKTLQQEINDRSAADETLQKNIESEVKASIEQEETNRQLADTSLENSINKCKKVFEYLNPTDTTYLIRHDLSTKDFLINVYSIDGADLQPTIYRLDGNNVKLTFNDKPSSFRVVIFSINEWALSKLAFNLGGKEWL